MATNQRQRAGKKSPAQSDQRRKTHEPASTGSYVQDLGSDVSRYVSRGASQVRDLTYNHAGTAVLVALGAGLGVGLLIGAALASSHSRPRSWRERIAAEGLGRRFLDRVERMMPDVLTEMTCK